MVHTNNQLLMDRKIVEKPLSSFGRGLIIPQTYLFGGSLSGMLGTKSAEGGEMEILGRSRNEEPGLEKDNLSLSLFVNGL